MSIRTICVITLLLAFPFAQAQNTTATTPPTVDAARFRAEQQQIEDAIKKSCKYNAEETDPKKITKVNHCEEKAIQAHLQKARLAKSLSVIAANESMFLEQPISAEATAGSPASSGASGNGAGVGTGIDPQLLMAGGSASNTPSTCGTGHGINSPLIRVHRVIMTPQSASDDFGNRLGHRFIVYQVSVENQSTAYQYMVQDISVDFSNSFNASPGTYRFSASGQDLTLLRGIPEKGQDLDKRNIVLHLLEGIGSVAGGISGLTNFADVMGSAVAVFNGPFTQSYVTLAPDHTSTQLNRLSDSAFIANTVIDKQGTKTIALFVPEDEIFSKYEQKRYSKDPYEFVGFSEPTGILSTADICVDGTFIQAVATVAPTLSKAVLVSDPAPGANVSTVVTITGTNLIQGDTQVVIGAGDTATEAMVLTSDGKNGTAQVLLPSNYSSATTAMLQSKSNKALNSGTAGIKMTIAP